jgi:hypothetical protein
MPLNALTYPIHQFVLVFFLVKVTKSYFLWKEKMSRHTGRGGEGVREMSPNVTRGGGLKSFTCYLNGPLLYQVVQNCQQVIATLLV